jgi:hypothetical protein
MENLLNDRLNKQELKKYIRAQVLLYRPELHHIVTDKIVNDTLHFAAGYIKCFRDFVHQPFNSSKEVDRFILSEIVNYAVVMLNT